MVKMEILDLMQNIKGVYFRPMGTPDLQKYRGAWSIKARIGEDGPRTWIVDGESISKFENNKEEIWELITLGRMW